MRNNKEYRTFAELLMRCADDDWTFQFERANENEVKITAFADEEKGLSFTVNVTMVSVDQVTYMIRKLMEEVESAKATETTGENRTLPA